MSLIGDEFLVSFGHVLSISQNVPPIIFPYIFFIFMLVTGFTLLPWWLKCATVLHFYHGPCCAIVHLERNGLVKWVNSKESDLLKIKEGLWQNAFSEGGSLVIWRPILGEGWYELIENTGPVFLADSFFFQLGCSFSFLLICYKENIFCSVFYLLSFFLVIMLDA